MPIRGFFFTNIEASKNLEPGEKMPKLQGFEHNNRIVNVQKFEMTRGKDSPEMLLIKFGFSSNYKPAFVSMKIEGSVLYSPKDTTVEQILAGWRSNRKLIPEVAQEVIGNIVIRCLQKATVLSDQLNVPPPFPIPTVKQPKGSDRPAKKGPQPDYYV